MRRAALGALAALAFGAPLRLFAQDGSRVATMATFDWGHQRPELIRYDRVEGLSLGARGAVRFGLAGVPVTAALTARLGTADRDPRGILSLERETVSRAIALSAYREIQTVEPAARALELGGSVVALAFGRDDGDYFQASGAALTWTPSAARPAWYRVRLFAEWQEPVASATQVSLFHWLGWDNGFRPATSAARAEQAGVEAMVSPWWGSDPTRPAAGFQLALDGERGDFDFARIRMELRALVPLPANVRLDLSAGAGQTGGEAPPQRRWMLGGPASLRGFAPGIATGSAFWSGRAEVTRPLRELRWLRAVDLTLFMDGGSAAEPLRGRWTNGPTFGSAGVGLSILDGALRLDSGWGWKGPPGRRLDLYFGGRR